MGLLTQSVRNAFGLGRQPSRGYSAMSSAYQAAQIDRLTDDWIIATLSPDQEIRMALRNLRARARQLAINNPHCKKFLDAAEEQVIGANGVALEVSFPEEFTGVEQLGRQIEKQWSRFAECCTADQKMPLPEWSALWLRTFLADGECFTDHVKGYPHNPWNFALQAIDADQVDISWQRLKSPGSKTGENEIRMGVELDEWRRPVAYWLYSGHPSESPGVRRDRVLADRIQHAFIQRRVNQTRGVPALHAAMYLMNMLGEYSKNELVASRWAACKMAFLVSKAGDEYAGGKQETDSDGNPVTAPDGPMIVDAAPGMFEQLPEGIEPKVIDWQHPSQNYETFSTACLRGIAAGLNTSYATLTGDLREVNFSSIRQGILSERDSWAVMQRFVVDHLCWPLFRAWLPMAIVTRQIVLPPSMQLDDVYEAVLWTPRGWDWVDPSKDVQASITAIRSGLSTYQRECAKRGLDWRKVLTQRAVENSFAAKLGLALDLTTAGSGGVEGDTGGEEPQRSAEPTKASAPQLLPAGKSNGHAERWP
jgi:lambda family phage portal protein